MQDLPQYIVPVSLLTYFSPLNWTYQYKRIDVNSKFLALNLQLIRILVKIHWLMKQLLKFWKEANFYKSICLQYRAAVSSIPSALLFQQKQRSFLTFGFGAGSGASAASRRESHVNVNVTPTSHDISSDTPEIRKYKKRFNSEILCAALWGEFWLEILKTPFLSFAKYIIFKKFYFMYFHIDSQSRNMFNLIAVLHTFTHALIFSEKSQKIQPKVLVEILCESH